MTAWDDNEAPERAATGIGRRKDHHLDICLDDQRYAVEGPAAAFDGLAFVHQALPELDATRIDTTVELLRHRLRLPLLISCMTGGSGRGRSANRALAAVAQQAGIAIGLGSVRPALEDESRLPDFAVKPLAPDVPVLANIGAVQLRDLGYQRLQPLLERLEVQALVVHLNAGQELFQPQGDRNFCGVRDALRRTIDQSRLPVLVKETGFGIQPALARELLGYGVAYVDLAGAGGTNWVLVEGYRLPPEGAASARSFADWGQPTAVLLAALGDVAGRVIASGGLRSGVDVAKTMALGAAAAGMALPFIRAVIGGGEQAATALVEQVAHELTTAMLLTGSRDLAALRRRPLLRSTEFRAQLAELQRGTTTDATAHQETEQSR